MIYDAVIVGGGAAGLMAALELTEKNKSVLVLEKGKSLNVSNFARAGGPAACETAIQEEENVFLSRDMLYTHMSSWAGHTVNEALLREVIGCTGAAVDRLQKLGIELELMPDTYGVGFRARHFIKSRGSKRTEPIRARIEEKGGKILCSCPVKRIERQGNRYRLSVLQDEKCLDFTCSAVLLCTGGFQGDPELIRRFFGLEHMVSMGNSLSSGDGIRLAEQLGAVCDRNFALPGNEGSASTTKCKGYNDNLCFGIYGGLLVDHNGRRFMNEKEIADFPLSIGGEAFARHGKTYAVVDHTVYQACMTEGIYHYMGQPDNWAGGKALWHPVLEHAGEHLQKAIEDGWACRAASIREAAEYFHLPALQETVCAYNQMCEKKEDVQFGKAAEFLIPVRQSPYYIFEYEPACWCTLGGIRTDSRLQALDASGRAIPGLYVAGAENGSMFSVPYYDNEGAALGLSLGSGIYAARMISADSEC